MANGIHPFGVMFSDVFKDGYFLAPSGKIHIVEGGAKGHEGAFTKACCGKSREKWKYLGSVWVSRGLLDDLNPDIEQEKVCRVCRKKWANS